jgi:hypothetical protein
VSFKCLNAADTDKSTAGGGGTYKPAGAPTEVVIETEFGSDIAKVSAVQKKT